MSLEKMQPQSAEPQASLGHLGGNIDPEVNSVLADYQEKRHQGSILAMGDRIASIVSHDYGSFKSTVVFAPEYVKKLHATPYRPELFE